tara:strand:+ start:1910 stop:2185 length:276 start_codon:yes stop_codon:yes gene_type:complete
MAYGTPLENQNKGYAAQERKNLLEDMPIDKRASGGSWMSKHVSSPLAMGHSPAEMGHSPAKNLNKGYGQELKSPMEMGHSPLEGHCMGKRK